MVVRGRACTPARDVPNASPIMGEEHENEQEAAGDGRDDEEIGRYDLADVILQEGAPGLGWWLAPAPHVFRDRGLNMGAFANCAPARNPGVTASTAGTATHPDAASAAREDRPLALGPAFAHLDRMAIGARHRQA
jgi:hypothetical protein